MAQPPFFWSRAEPEPVLFMAGKNILPVYPAIARALSALRTAAARHHVIVASVGLLLLALVAYLGSFSVPFVFDDTPSILENRSIRQLWPLTDVLLPDQAGGVTSSGRPLVNLSFALNYALSGYEVWSYHAFNLAVHACAGLCLLGLIRRTLLAPPLSARFGAASDWLAFAVSALWILHPLQTESVTYVVQRAEALVALFYLLTLYAFVRGAETPGSRGWWALALAACLGGMASKEVMSSAPLIVLLYDRTFWSESLGQALRRRRGFYLGLAATWLVLAWLIIGTGGRGGTAGFSTGISSWSYALTQCRAVIHYVTLALWPHPLVFDHGLATERDWIRVLPQALVLLAALAGVAVALHRRSPWGFAGAMFFAVLAPSSSFVPVATQTMAEHRMYLPLAVLIAGGVLGGFALVGPKIAAGIAAAALALALSTMARNHDYRSEIAIWGDTAGKLPSNARAHNNLGQALFRAGRIPEAVQSYERALVLQPKYPETHYNLGVARLRQGEVDRAIGHYEAALRWQPDYPEALNNLANALVQAGRPAEALRRYEEAVARRPDFAEAQNNLGNALLQAGRGAEARARFERALQLRPGNAETLYNLGNALASAGDMAGALERFRQALQRNPRYAAAHVNAGNALLEMKRPVEALAHYDAAVAADAALPDAFFNRGSVLLDLERWRDAIPAFEAVLRLRPAAIEAHRALGFALAQSDRPAQAIPHYERYVSARPDDASAREELARLRAAVAGGRGRN